ncbi:MAG: M15 family metallopeptidase [Ruminococcus sp.]|nr:M15 family metallopeptidase [Ruminococcus sp.]
MPKNDISKSKSIQRAKAITQLVICGVVVAVGAFYVKGVVDGFRTVPSLAESNSAGTSDIDIETPTTPDPNKTVCAPIAVKTKNKFYGDLILVNNDHQYYSSGEEDLVNIADKNAENDIYYFVTDGYDYQIISPVYDAMIKMIGDFYEKYQNDTLIIYGSYRTHAQQEQLYEEKQEGDESGDAPLVAKPGHSEHETGYAFDFSESETYDYEGTGDFKWINDNCYKYGFVVRYTAEKEKLTQIRPEPWHFRYVGIPHAYYMTKNNLCLEEYISMLSEKYSYEGEHLLFADENGKNYEVYFFPSDDGADETMVPVPTANKYTISGNNVDGFIVTVYKDEALAAEDVQPTTEAVTEDTENSGETEDAVY